MVDRRRSFARRMVPVAAVALTLAFPITTRSAAGPLPGFVVDSRAAIAPGGPIAAGFDLTIHRLATPAAKLHLVTLYVPTDGAVVTIRAVDRQGDAETLVTRAGCPASAAAINGGFYIRDQAGARPLGLVRIDGVTRSKPSKRKFGGFLVVADGRLAVLPRDAVAPALKAAYAIESSPRLMEGGVGGIRGDNGERFDRVAIGTSADGGVLVIGVFGEDQDTVRMGEFSTLAAAAAGLAGHPARDLIAMDGGPSAHIRLGAQGKFYGYRGPAFLPNVVCLAKS